jgi:NADH-quinone oxidoreductase subunit N
MVELFSGLSIILVFSFGLFLKKTPQLIQTILILFWAEWLILISDSDMVLLKSLLIVFLLFYMFLLKNVSYEYLMLTLIFKLGTLLLLESKDFLIFYLSLELSSFVLYLLVASRKENIYSTEAGLKYFILGSLSSIILLLGISLCYGLVGSLEFIDIYMFGTDLLWDEGKVYLRVSYLLILIGLFFKLGLVPFHFWIPDVYEGSTWLVIYMLGVVSKIGAFGVTVRLIYQVFDFEFEMTSLLLVLVGFGSIGVGVLSALRQRSLKRLVGYSGITHMGFLVLGLSTGTGLGMFVTFFYLIFYLCLNVSWIVLFRYLELESLEELKRVLGSVGIYLLIMIFSIVGIPPLGGFFIKFFLLFSLIQVEFWIPVILIIVGSLVAAYYYLRLVQMVYFTEKDERSLVKEDLGSLYVLGGLSYTNLFLIVGQNYIWI